MKTEFAPTMKKSLLALSAASALLALSSCMSVGYRVDLKTEEGKDAASKLKSPPRYYIAAFSYDSKEARAPKAADFSGHIDPFADKKPEDRNTPRDIDNLRDLVSNECRARYPTLFAADGEMAVPILVLIKAEIGEENATIGPFLSGFCTLGTIPGPFSMQFVYKVNVAPCEGALQAPSQELPDTRACVFEQAGWVTVFSPLGLIPYWGKTDDPPVSFTMSNMDTGMADFKRRNLALFADAIAIELLKRQPQLAAIAPRPASLLAAPSSIYAAPAGSAPAPAPSQAPGGGLVAPTSQPQSSGINSL